LKELAEKYLNDTCTKREARKVLTWFGTPEGKAFLEEKLDDDLRKRGVKNDPFSKLHSAQNVPLKEEKHTYYFVHRKGFFKQPLITKAAAVILFLMMGTGFYWIFQSGGGAKMQQKEYTTGPHQQGKITLADGTHIRLNQNSQLWLSQDPSGKYRKVRLKGEAFFEITHNPEKPFVVSTSQALIQDIGTAFDVKARPEERNVQVAVVEGEVLFKSKKEVQKHAPQVQAPKGQAVRLTKGHFGVLKAGQSHIKIDQFAVKNYLSWMDHHYVFVDAPLSKVGRQLTRLYDVNFVLTSSDLQSLKITADFKADSLDKILSVIAQTLHIKFKKNGDKIVWLDE
jgi:ferric-dicitrate binding protein FerR (iron transport regulator)